MFGNVEQGCFFEVVDDRTKETFLNIIQRNILPRTKIMSDCWRSYNCLSDNGFSHLSVNHSVTFKDPETITHTNTIEDMYGYNKREF